jgi:hypothetical protein
MRHKKRRLIPVTALLFGFSAQAQEPTPSSTVGETLLHPLSITITGHLDAPSPATSLTGHLDARSPATSGELAVRYIGDQIEQKRAAEAAAAQLPAFWRASFWKYLPKSSGGTMNSPIAGDDDPVTTPTYLTLSARLLEREVEASDKATKLLFAK